MNKIEKLHLEAINSNIFSESNYASILGKREAASKLANITEQVAVKFGYFLATSNWASNGYKYGRSTEQLYKEFLKLNGDESTD